MDVGILDYPSKRNATGGEGEQFIYLIKKINFDTGSCMLKNKNN